MSLKYLQIDNNTDESQINYLQNLVIHSKCNKSFYESQDTGISAKFVMEGIEHYHINNKDFYLKPNEILFVNRQAKVDINIDNYAEGICVYMSPEDLKGMYNALCAKNIVNEKETSHEFDFDSIYQTIPSCIKNQLPYLIAFAKENKKPDLLDSIYLVFMESLLRNSILPNKYLHTENNYSQKQELSKRLHLMNEYIYDNHAVNIDLDNLSKIACISKYYLIRLFREVYQTTPHKYLLELRLNNSFIQLKGKEKKSISDIALDCGFYDLQAFNKAFKKKFGYLPSAVKNN